MCERLWLQGSLTAAKTTHLGSTPVPSLKGQVLEPQKTSTRIALCVAFYTLPDPTPSHPMRVLSLSLLAITTFATSLYAQLAPYDVFPQANPPYYRVRYEASTLPGELIFPVNYTIWIPPGVQTLRGLIVHQHGCGEGSCKSGLTGAFDLHWQALAAKHQCALLSPSYEQPEKADCQMWCDPRNGSSDAFQKGLKYQTLIFSTYPN